jgi:hypothetical protein
MMKTDGSTQNTFSKEVTSGGLAITAVGQRKKQFDYGSDSLQSDMD